MYVENSSKTFMRLRRKLLRSSKLMPSGCREWQRAKSGHGYGQAYLNGKTISAHRLSYIMYVSVIPKGFYVLHGCDNPACISPAHLRLGTQLENMQDAIKRDRFQRKRIVITPDKVRLVRQLLRAREMSQAGIANKVGCSQRTVSAIKTGRSWKWVS